MTDFEYKPISLEGPAFRLLRLLKGNYDDPIQCQLFESKLALPEHTTASPEHICDYAALSYTWGNTSRPCDIIVNGSNMAVTKNAYLALRDLRCQEQDQVLWVDALCINQDDNDEQGQQVQQMGSIYSEAKRVFIWLGEATYDTDYVMYYMKKLEKESFKHASNGQEISELVNIWSVVVRDLTPDQRGLLVEGLQSLLHRSWFKRVWIIQEAANAQVAEVVCGGKSISASIFALMPTLLEITPEPDCQPILDIMPGSRRNDSWWAQKRDLYTMLDKFRSSEATDPRDKIYALLGISSNACDTDLLRADYAKNLEDTIFDTTSFILNLSELDPPICRFFDWTLPEFLRNLDVLANKVLHCAKDTGHKAVVKMLLETGEADMDSKDYDGQTPLSWAAEKGHEAVVKLLLERGAQIESIDKYYRTPLSWAAENGHEAVVKLLLARGAQIESTDLDRRTPLSWAAKNGHEAVVKLLLDRGARIESTDTDYRTPLLWAAEMGHEAVVKLLLERGAQIKSWDIYIRTPLSWAAENGHETVVKLLLETGKADMNSKDYNGQTPLSLATKKGHETVVELLLERDAQIKSRDKGFRALLSSAKTKMRS
jgi:ankyrin repeat protein